MCRLEIVFVVQGKGLAAFLIGTVTIRSWWGVLNGVGDDPLRNVSIRIESFDDGKGVTAIPDRSVYRLEVGDGVGWWGPTAKATADPSAREAKAGVRDDSILAVASREPARHFL